jgi:alkylation response protein AidB-like acyl-CoA dehydrogenase
MRRRVFEEEHELFRESFRRFLDKEVVPHHLAWEKAGIVPHELFTAAGAHGFLGISLPERYGGGGVETSATTS